MRLPLSMYVVETTYKDKPVLFNTVTKKHLPVDSSDAELLENHFFQGSENDAIWSYMTKSFPAAAFTVINTWECNLRCTHCTVIDKLVKKDSSVLDIPATVDFLNRFKNHHNLKCVYVTFLGGEPLLHTKVILDFMDMTDSTEFEYNITTNLTLPFTDEMWECFKRLNVIGVSLDGVEDAHNSQRRPLQLNNNPYWQTINNIKNLVKAGFRDKIRVQSALADKYVTEDHRREYYRTLMKLGIPSKNIKFACIHPTERNPNLSRNYIESLTRGGMVTQPCCKYRNSNYIIDRDGDIFTDYYTWKLVGNIKRDVSDLDGAARTVVMEMPALNDPTCKSCPVIGYCWGGCTNGEIAIGKNPSKYCNQESLIQSVEARAKSGTLIRDEKK